MRKTSFKLLSASLAVAMTMSSMPYNVLVASPEQTFAQAVQQAQTTEADGFETAAPAEENLVTADAESTEKVTYTVTPGVSYGKGSIKLISGVTESTGDDGEKVYGPRPLMMFTRVMVNGTPPSVRKREEKPPPRKYSWIAGHHSVAARQASASFCSISQ